MLSKIISGFGSIVSITSEVTKYGPTTVKTGVRIVKVEVDEVGKSNIPRLLHVGAWRW